MLLVPAIRMPHRPNLLLLSSSIMSLILLKSSLSLSSSLSVPPDSTSGAGRTAVTVWLSRRSEELSSTPPKVGGSSNVT